MHYLSVRLKVTLLRLKSSIPCRNVVPVDVLSLISPICDYELIFTKFSVKTDQSENTSAFSKSLISLRLSRIPKQ